MEKLSIKIMIGNRAYSMKVPMEEEQKVRLAAKELNKKISKVGKKNEYSRSSRYFSNDIL